MADLLKMITESATTLGVLFAGSQLYLAQRHAQTAFEDQLSTQYREIIRKLPVGALLGETLSDEELDESLRDFLHYIDLCNEQAYLREHRRIRRSTWNEWSEGSRENLARPAFAQAWGLIAARAPETFDNLRSIAPPPLFGHKEVELCNDSSPAVSIAQLVRKASSSKDT
jgi:hypothetical protein